MKDLGKTMAGIAKKLAEREKRQDSVIVLSREVIRDCANAIKDIHTGELKQARSLEKQIDAKMRRLSEIQADFEGTASQAFQEYVEVKSLLSILERKPLPDFEKLGVDYRQFLSGLADVVGELRRAMLISLKNKNRKNAEYLFECMESIYDHLMVLKYSSSLVGALKSKQDMIRAQVEKARSELLEIK